MDAQRARSFFLAKAQRRRDTKSYKKHSEIFPLLCSYLTCFLTDLSFNHKGRKGCTEGTKLFLLAKTQGRKEAKKLKKHSEIFPQLYWYLTCFLPVIGFNHKGRNGCTKST